MPMGNSVSWSCKAGLLEEVGEIGQVLSVVWLSYLWRQGPLEVTSV